MQVNSKIKILRRKSQLLFRGKSTVLKKKSNSERSCVILYAILAFTILSQTIVTLIRRQRADKLIRDDWVKLFYHLLLGSNGYF